MRQAVKSEYTNGPKYWGTIAVGPNPNYCRSPSLGDPKDRRTACSTVLTVVEA